jgi:polysaccharide biosynthesis/export protein
MRILSLTPLLISTIGSAWAIVNSQSMNAASETQRTPQDIAEDSVLKALQEEEILAKPVLITPPEPFQPGQFIRRAEADLKQIEAHQPTHPTQDSNLSTSVSPNGSLSWDRVVSRSLTGQSSSENLSGSIHSFSDHPAIIPAVAQPEWMTSPLFVSQTPVAQTSPPSRTANAANGSSSSNRVNDTYILGAGDRIQINIFNVPEYSGEHQVLADGSLNLPVVGNVPVAGLTLEQAGGAIASSYSAELQVARVTVSLLKPRPLQVAIVGEVNRPGLYTLPLSEDAQFPGVVQAVQTAGGTTQAANLRTVELRRPLANGRIQTITVNLWELLNNGDLSQNLSLRDGDTLLIAPTTEVNLAETAQLAASNLSANSPQILDVAIVGEVSRPGAYKLGTTNDNNSRPTLTQAIQTAGGATPIADLRNVQVMRSTRSGVEQVIDINLMQLIQSGDLSQDLILQQGDRVVIAKAEALTPEEIARLTTANVSPDEIQVNIVGEVVTPGMVKLEPNTTLNQAVLAAGGLNRRARRRVELVRINPNGTLTRQNIEMDLSQGVNSETNPVLWNNDVVIVGRSTGARLSDSLDSILGPIFRIIPFIY